MAESYRWKPISTEGWRNTLPMISLVETWRDLKPTLKPEVEERVELEIAREWAIETGQIEHAFDLDRASSDRLIESGFLPELVPEQENGLSREQVVSMLGDAEEALGLLIAQIQSREPLRTSFVRELHQLLMRNDLGFRDGEVAGEMERLVAMHWELREAGKPAEVIAAWVHHAFAQIHPFEDGNGRVARALASLELLRVGLPPFTVPREFASRYFDALLEADRGRPGDLIRMFTDCLGRQLERYWGARQGGGAPMIESGSAMKEMMENAKRELRWDRFKG